MTSPESDTYLEELWSTAGPMLRLIESTEDLFTVVDDQGRFLYVNPAAERVLGVEQAECVGRSAFDFVHPEDLERTRAAFLRWIRSEPQPLVFENRQLHADGSVRDMLWTITRQERGDGGMLLASCARDVTELRTRERDLATRELRLRSLLEGMLDAVVTIDEHGTIEFASDSVRDVFGYDPEELVGRNVSVLMPEPHRSQHDSYLERYAETGETWILGRTREFEAVRKNGARFWIELSVSRVEAPGDAPRFCGSFRDVTDRKQAERALGDSEKRFRAIFDQEFQLVGLLGPSGIVIEMNRAAMELIGARRGDVIGHLFWETPWWSSGDLGQRCHEWVRRAARGEFIREEVDLVARGGGTRTMDFSLKPVVSGKGRVEFLIPEGRDITELRRSQKRETQVLKALAAIGESASILAHEIKNPITSINLALRAVASKLGEDERETLTDLVGRMQRLEGTIRRTLSFAKPLELARQRTDVLPLLLEVVDVLREEADERDVEVSLAVAEGCPALDVDPGLVGEVVTNLVKNALEAVVPGGRVRVAARALEGDEVELVVEDDGPGLPESQIDNLFRPFVTTKAQGTGLGLPLVRKVVEEHGGRIEAGRCEMGGARFCFTLPAAHPPPTA